VGIRALAPHDLDAVLAIQSSAPEAAQWSRADYERACETGAAPIQGSSCAWLAAGEAGVVGFILTRQAGDELEILNLAVAPAARRAGAGTRLLVTVLERVAQHGARCVSLEVRESHSAAIAFYERHGLVRARRRPDSYSAPREAALVLRREHAPC
jgi:ribosomal-protein-alanine N-acetyltransferase